MRVLQWVAAFIPRMTGACQLTQHASFLLGTPNGSWARRGSKRSGQQTEPAPGLSAFASLHAQFKNNQVVNANTAEKWVPITFVCLQYALARRHKQQ